MGMPSRKRMVRELRARRTLENASRRRRSRFDSFVYTIVRVHGQTERSRRQSVRLNPPIARDRAVSNPFYALILLLAALNVHAAEPPQRYEAVADGTLVIEPDGRVGEVTLPEALEEPLRSKYLAQIRAWKFRPIVENGAPVRARAHLVARLFIEEKSDGDGMVAGIADVQFVDPPVEGETNRAKLVPPIYPRSLIERRIGGVVVLTVETDANGKVERVAPRRGTLFVPRKGMRPRNAEASFAQLVKASERAVLQWTLPDCKGSCEVPIRYTLGRAGEIPFWLPVLDVPVTPAPWMPADGEARQLTATGLAPSTRFELLSSIDDGAIN
jgi:hypothetical protein